MVTFLLNDKLIQTDLNPGITVLDFVRYHQHLKGTKIGCREGDCGACTVLVGQYDGKLSYHSMTSCLMPLGNAAGKHIVTVEGVNVNGLNQIQQAISDAAGTQCGFCTVGFVMSLVGYSLSDKEANSQNALASIDGNICRCTGYKSLERAAQTITTQLESRNSQHKIEWLIENDFIPAYFSTIEQKLADLQKPEIEPSHSVFVGGGTDLYVQKHEEMVHATSEYLFNKAELNGIIKDGSRISFGASVTVEDLRSSELMLSIFPNLISHLKLVSSTQIRNMATLAGNFVNGSPIGDMTIFFLALNTEIQLKRGGERRVVLLKNLYTGYKKLIKQSDEIVERIYITIPEHAFYFNFEKVCKRTHLDIASVNAACFIQESNGTITHASFSVGGVFAFPRFLQKTSDYLLAKALEPQTIIEAAEILQSEIAPIADVRGSEAYKRLLARQLFFAHFLTLFPDRFKPEQLFFQAPLVS
jgi:xanthine dehydrogenase small subunit